MLLFAACIEAEAPAGTKDCAPATWYGDGDGDGHGAADFTVDACEAPDRYVASADDCDDTDPAVSPAAVESCNEVDDDCDGETDEEVPDAPSWWLDADADGFGGEATSQACTVPEGYATEGGDCDDTDATVNPDAIELCDGLDQNCSGDEADATDPSEWYADTDGDGAGDPESAVLACDVPAGHTDDRDDCDDARAEAHRGAQETCNGLDDDCDGTPDDNPSDPGTWYFDADGDGFGAGDRAITACDQPSFYSDTDDDCDDADAAVFPGAAERCDAEDTDCDGIARDAESTDASAFYADADGDGFGDASAASLACDAPADHVADASDCDDAAASIFPGADETCDGADDDCDGSVDEDGAVDGTAWYADADGDGYGDPAVVTLSCGTVAGAVENADDCDDAAADAFPGGSEACGDGVDQDCSGAADDGCGPIGSVSTADADVALYGSSAYDYSGFGAAMADTDLTGDGVLDLTVAEAEFVYVYAGPVTSASTAFTVYEPPYVLGGAMQGGDHDADGVDDLMITRTGGTTPGVYVIGGPVTVGDYAFNLDLMSVSMNPYDAITAELDGDAARELVVSSTYAYVYDDVTGTHSASTAAWMATGSSYAYGIGAGDFDGDGLDNLFVEAATVWMFSSLSESMDAGTADASWTKSTTNDVQFSFADVGGDGVADMVVSSWGDQFVWVVEGGTGSGKLDAVATCVIDATYYPANLYADAAPLDGDDHAEVAVASSNVAEVALFYGPLSGSLELLGDADARIATSAVETHAAFVDVGIEALGELAVGVPQDAAGGTSSGGAAGAVYLFAGGG